jgi:hypothetical protein
VLFHLVPSPLHWRAADRSPPKPTLTSPAAPSIPLSSPNFLSIATARALGHLSLSLPRFRPVATLRPRLLFAGATGAAPIAQSDPSRAPETLFLATLHYTPRLWRCNAPAALVATLRDTARDMDFIVSSAVMPCSVSILRDMAPLIGPQTEAACLRLVTQTRRAADDAPLHGWSPPWNNACLTC